MMSAIGLPHASSASSLPQNVPSDSTSPRVPTALTRQPSTSLCAPSLTSLSLPTPPAITSAAPQAVLGTVNWSVHSASVDVALTCNLLRFQLDKFKEKKLKNKILSSVPLKLTTCILDTCYSHLFSALGVVAVDNAKCITRRVPRARLENVFGPEWQAQLIGARHGGSGKEAKGEVEGEGDGGAEALEALGSYR